MWINYGNDWQVPTIDIIRNMPFMENKMKVIIYLYGFPIFVGIMWASLHGVVLSNGAGAVSF